MVIQSRRSSQVLHELLNQELAHVTYQHVLDMLGARAFGIVLLLFALLNALPFAIVPGMSVIFGIPILIFAAQMIFARKTLWLPSVFAKRSLSFKVLAVVVNKAMPYLVRIEYFLKPRWLFMTSSLMEIFHGITIFILAVFLMLPIPFSNFIIAALLMIFSLGLIEKDGILLIIGYCLSLLYGSFVYFFIMVAVRRFY